MANLLTHCVLWASILKLGGPQGAKDALEITKNTQMMLIRPNLEICLEGLLWMMMTLGVPEGQGFKKADLWMFL